MRIAIDGTLISAAQTTGSSRYTLTLLEGLAARDEGRGVVVFLSDYAAEGRLPVGHPFEVHRIKLRSALGAGAREYARQFSVRRLCRKLGVDLLHAPLDPVWKMRRVPQVVTLHDMAWSEEHVVGLEGDTLRERGRAMARYLLAKRADRIITVSRFSKERIMDLLSIPSERISRIYSGLPPSFLHRCDSPEAGAVRARYELPLRYILFVGQFGRQKNEGSLIAAWKQVVRDGRQVDLVIVGSGPQPAAYTPGLHIHRDVPDQDLSHFYTGASAFCLPSYYEGFGLPVIEAMACGLPVVVSEDTALEEIAGDAGTLIDPADVDSIAAGLVMALDATEEDRQRSRARAAHFSIDQMVDRTLDAYVRAMRR